MSAKRRVDQLMVERGLASSRTRAQAAIAEGRVRSSGRPVARASDMLDAEAALDVAPGVERVSRGGVKLAHALDALQWTLDGLVVLDLGASTGGFTEEVLRRGAARVHAIDVGHGQLHERLVGDRRIVLHEGLNARHLTAADVPEPVDVIVCDVSFISATLVLGPAMALAAPDARLIVLVKPQFEVGRAGVGKGGVVHDKAGHDRAIANVQAFIENKPDWRVAAVRESPIEGAKGNREFLLAARRGGGA